jgi:integrase
MGLNRPTNHRPTIRGADHVPEVQLAMQVKLRHVNREVDRHNVVRFYYRKGKGRRIPLEGQPGTDEFLASYERAKATDAAPKEKTPVKVREVRKNTLRWLCVEYFGSAEFKLLDPRTQKVRRQILEHCLDEPVEPGSQHLFADYPLDRITARAIKVLRDRKLGAPEAANSRVKALRQVFAFGLDEEDEHGNALVDRNPARDVSYFDGNSEGIHAWSLAEVEQYEKKYPTGTKARLALDLLLYTCQRRSDVVRFGRQHVRNEVLTFTQFKGRKRKPVTLELPIIPALRKSIDATKTGDMTFLINDLNRGFSDAGFGNKFREWCNKAGLPQCSAHGLRKAGAARLAELGCTDRQIMAITGHLTEKEVTRYTRSANQKVMAKAAMKRLAKNTR